MATTQDQRLKRRQELSRSYPYAKSVCSCGHTGDGPHSQHGGVIGHGGCTARGCFCAKFTWAENTPAFAALLETA